MAASTTSSNSTQLENATAAASKQEAASIHSTRGDKLEDVDTPPMKEGVQDHSSSSSSHNVDTDVEHQATKEEPPITHRAALLLFVGLTMATFLASLDGTIIATALPKIASDLKSPNQMSWVATAYLLTFNAFQPLYGKFSDIFGRKASILFACITFMIGSAGAGGATTMEMLIAFRAIQGLGGSGLMGVVLIIISDVFTLEQRPKYQSIIWSVFGISSVIGPLLGGVFVEKSTWRWAFLINLPLGVVTIVSVVIFLRLPFQRPPLKEQLARVDYAGTILIIVAVICLLLPTTWGGVEYPWNSWRVILLFAISAVLIVVLVIVESKAVEAIIPPRLFKNWSVSVIFLVNFMTGMSFLGVIFYAPIYFQVVKGVTATASGLHLLPMVLGLVGSSIVSGALMAKVGDIRIFIWLGTICSSVGIGLLRLWDADSNMGPQIGYLLIVGVGIGLIMQTCMLAAQAAVEKEDMAIVTAMCGFMNSIGGGIGIAMCSALFNNHLKEQFFAFPMDVKMVIAQYNLAESLTAVQDLPEETKRIVLGAYVDTFQYIFRAIFPIACASFVLSLAIRKLRLLDPSEIVMAAA